MIRSREVAAVVDTGRPATITRRVGALDRCCEGRAFVLEGDRLAILFVEVTERKVADARLTLDDRFRETTDPAAMSFVAASLIGEVLGADRIGCGMNPFHCGPAPHAGLRLLHRGSPSRRRRHERAENERLREIIRAMGRHRFSRCAESPPDEQLLFALEEQDGAAALAIAEAKPARKVARVAKRRTNRGALPAHLSRVERVVDVASTACPCCAGTLHGSAGTCPSVLTWCRRNSGWW